MYAYTITHTGKVWLIDDSQEGVVIPPWCYNKEGYHVVEELPQDIKDLLEQEERAKEIEKLKDEFNEGIIKYLNSTCLEYGFTGDSQTQPFRAVANYVGFDNEYREIAEKLGAWIASVFKVAEAIEADVLAGNREMPTLDEVLAELPVFQE